MRWSRRTALFVVVDKDRRVAVDEQLFLVRIGEAFGGQALSAGRRSVEPVSDSLAHLPRPMTADDRIVGRVAWCGPHSAVSRLTGDHSRPAWPAAGRVARTNITHAAGQPGPEWGQTVSPPPPRLRS